MMRPVGDIFISVGRDFVLCKWHARNGQNSGLVPVSEFATNTQKFFRKGVNSNFCTLNKNIPKGYMCYAPARNHEVKAMRRAGCMRADCLQARAVPCFWPWVEGSLSFFFTNALGLWPPTNYQEGTARFLAFSICILIVLFCSLIGLVCFLTPRFLAFSIGILIGLFSYLTPRLLAFSIGIFVCLCFFITPIVYDLLHSSHRTVFFILHIYSWLWPILSY